MASELFIGVDLGAESGRVMSGAFDGNQMTLTEHHRFATGGTWLGDSMHWDVLNFWKQIQTGLGHAARFSKDHSQPIKSIGVDTWGVDYVLLDANKRPMGFPFHYRDPRNEGMVEQLASRIPRSEIYEQTGIQFMDINTLCQLFAANQEGSLDEALRFLMMPDYFNWCLTGVEVGEFTIATTSQCYDPAAGDWARSLLQKLEIPTEMFPEIAHPGTNIGKVRSRVRELTGLNEDVDVILPGGHDTASAVAAIPVQPEFKNNWAYISSGTWSLVGLELPKPVLTEAALAANVTNEGGVAGTWRLLKNVVGLWLIQQLKSSLKMAGTDMDYQQLTDAAEQAAPFRTLVDVDDAELLKPQNIFPTIETICKRTGEPMPESPGAFARCLLESLAFKYRCVIESLQQIADYKVKVIHIVGGGSKNRLLNQFVAEACAMPVVGGPVEATFLGNVLVQCKSNGEAGSLEEMREIVRNSFPLDTFEPRQSQLWNDNFDRFKNLSNG